MQLGIEAISAVVCACVSILGLLAGVVLYLIRVEKTLARIDTTLLSFCGESQRDRTQIWRTITETKEEHHQLAQRVGIVETKVALQPHGQRSAKPA